MEQTNRTNKQVLFKGIKLLVFALLSLFMGPILYTVAETQPDSKYYIPLVIISVLVCAFAVFLVFKGIKTIMDSMFKK